MAKKHVCPEPEIDTSGEWLASYGDLVTLLMAFFVMLFAMSTTDAKKFEQLIVGLAGPFNNIGAFEISAGRPSGPSNPGKKMVSQSCERDVEPGGKEDGKGQGMLESNEQIKVIQKNLEKSVRDIKDSHGELAVNADIRDDSRGFVINLSTDNVLFKVGSAELTPMGKDVIKQIAPALISAPNTIVVEGHTDNAKFSGTTYDNWNLAADRAVAVTKELIVNRFPPERVSATSYGEYRPKVPNDSEKNRAINRRVEILVVSLAQSAAAAGLNPVADQQGAGLKKPLGQVVTAPDLTPDVSPNINPRLNPNAVD